MTNVICGIEEFVKLDGSLNISRLDAEFVSLWNQFVSLSPHAFYETLSLDFPGLRVEFWLYPTGVGGATITFDEQESEVLFSEIAFDFVAKRVELKELRVNPADQDRGLSKYFMRNLVELSIALGMNGIDFVATEVGAYSFARMGGVPTKEDWLELREQIRERANALPLSDAQRQQIMTLLESDDPRTIWKIADL
ncbi:MAG TPA: hypothetical protein VHX14_07035 [Thermoanaerobaculia bacterium]|jgi:hypothetical protein|nr:hypothetical protein [Thermoanaerobaculia bacterium]